MRICFSQDQKHIVFLHETAGEYKALADFPAFTKQGIYNTCPSILPIAYSVITRVMDKFKKARLDQNVTTWLEQDFKLAVLPDEFRYHTEPKNFQDIALRYMHTINGGGILLDPGMGKTKVVLDFIWLRKFKRSIVVCPVPLLFVWEDEIKRHRPELTYHVVTSTNWEDEIAAGALTKDIVIINYTKVAMMKWSLRNAGFEYIHLDEFLIKDITTTRTQSCLELSRYIPYHSGGSGTLINNTPLDCYAPIRFLQPSLVGYNYANFRDKYTVQQPRKDVEGNNTNNKQIVAFKGVPEMKSILESCSIVMTKEKWLQLPAKHFHDTRVHMGVDQKRTYYELARNLTTKIGDRWVTVDNPLVTMAKLYQIANGFVYLYPDNDESEAEAISDLLAEDVKIKKRRKASERTIHFFHPCHEQPKMVALENLLTTKIPERKAMIWFNMEAEVIMIEATLQRLGLKYLVIKGGDKTIGQKVRAFNSDPSIKYLVCQAKSVNYGITVMGSKKKDLEDLGIEVMPGVDTAVYTQIYISLNFSLEVYLQQQDRIHRLGQEHECDYFRLFTISPVEMKIMKAIEDKQLLRKDMLVDVADTLLSEIEEFQ